jgi:hypothetical protein
MVLPLCTVGIVHVNVGQKLVKSNILQVFLLSDGYDCKPILSKVILKVIQSIK